MVRTAVAKPKKSRKKTKPAKTKPSAKKPKPSTKKATPKKKPARKPRKKGGGGVQYGVLRGKVVGGRREPDGKSPHYQIRIEAERDGDAAAVWRVPVNVRSQDGSEVLFFTDENLTAQAPDRHEVEAIWKKKLKALDKLADGWTPLPSHKPGIALDYVRESYVDREEMLHLPASGVGANDDVQDVVELYVARARKQGAVVFVFGSRFDDTTESGVHDIHMNQGNKGAFAKDNGIYQDGGIVMRFASGRDVGMFFAFQSQKWSTEDQGNGR